MKEGIQWDRHPFRKEGARGISWTPTGFMGVSECSRRTSPLPPPKRNTQPAFLGGPKQIHADTRDTKGTEEREEATRYQRQRVIERKERNGGEREKKSKDRKKDKVSSGP